MTIDPIRWYDAHAPELARRYESIRAEQLHAWMADLLPQGKGVALDIGAGTGRDAAWLASHGMDVVAVEPSTAMREQALALRPGPNVRWIADSLPDLREVLRTGLSFDVILLSAVWMHVPEVARERAFRKIVTLLKPGGMIAITLGFGARADVMLARRDGSRRVWIEFEISRADPVANHAKFAAAHLFEPRPTTDIFVSMVSTHVTRGRSNLAASAVYLMRAVGMAAFQTHLLPDVEPDRIHDLNQRPLERLLEENGIDAASEIERAMSVSHEVAAIDGHRIHFAASLFEVMLNAAAWNTEIRTAQGSDLWGRRTVTYFVHNPRTGEFAPAKFCAFVPLGANPSPASPMASMTLGNYAALDESETRFDGHVAKRHLTSRLSMREEPLDGSACGIAERFADWHREFTSRITLHPRGPIILLPPTWW